MARGDRVLSAITTHVLDTFRGKPAAGVPIVLEIARPGGKWKQIAKGATDGDGRLRNLLSEKAKLAKATYRISFDTSKYFKANKMEGFYPVVHVIFQIKNPKDHYHVPLLLSPYGYSTYRGS